MAPPVGAPGLVHQRVPQQQVHQRAGRRRVRRPTCWASAAGWVRQGRSLFQPSPSVCVDAEMGLRRVCVSLVEALFLAPGDAVVAAGGTAIVAVISALGRR